VHMGWSGVLVRTFLAPSVDFVTRRSMLPITIRDVLTKELNMNPLDEFKHELDYFDEFPQDDPFVWVCDWCGAIGADPRICPKCHQTSLHHIDPDFWAD